jgi:hypothetical protein
MQPLLVVALLLGLPSFHSSRPQPPAFIRVENFAYRITFVERFADPNQLGEVDYAEHRIRLRSGLPLEDEAEDLMHELLHAMLKDEGTREEMTGHDFIYLVAPKLIHTLYAENPQLGRYMDRATRRR